MAWRVGFKNNKFKIWEGNKMTEMRKSEAEKAILASILTNNDAIEYVMKIVSAADFTRKENRLIFVAMADLRNRNRPIDLIMLTEYMKERDLVEEFGGKDHLVDYLATLVDAISSSVHILTWAKLLKGDIMEDRKEEGIKPEVIGKFPPFRRHHITQNIINEMLTLEMGAKISYPRLKEISEVDCQEKRTYLRSALNILRKEHKRVFKVIPNWGYRRVTDEEIAHGTGKERGKRIKTQIKKAHEELLAVEFDKLTDAGKVKHNLHSALFGALGIFFKPSKQKKLESEIEYQGKALDFNETVKLFEK